MLIRAFFINENGQLLSFGKRSRNGHGEDQFQPTDIVALQDKNGVLPIQLILACAEAVWDALHFDGPGLEPEQRQVVSA